MADNVSRDRVGGIVLCGGRSVRMGRPKALLPFGPEVLLQRMVRIVKEVVSPVVVVAARDQELPPLPADVRIARDVHEALGPLAGLSVGLRALRPEVVAAYVTACDTPLLRPEFIKAVIERLGEHDLAIPREGEFNHPLAAVYRTSLLSKIDPLIEAGRLRPRDLVPECDALEIDVADLRSVDPELDSLRNVNTPEEYAAVLTRAEIP